MRYLYVAAEQTADGEAVATVGSSLTTHFAVPTREIPLPEIAFAFDLARRQHSSIAVLEMLTRICPDDALKLLAVTTHDLFIPVLTFVFGQAQLGGRVGVISLARLRQEFYGLPPDRDIFLQRTAKEALHETGHLFGLVHCADRACAMSLATGVRQIDQKHSAFCDPCRGRISASHSRAGHPPRETFR